MFTKTFTTLALGLLLVGYGASSSQAAPKSPKKQDDKKSRAAATASLTEHKNDDKKEDGKLGVSNRELLASTTQHWKPNSYSPDQLTRRHNCNGRRYMMIG